ncbi:MAG: phosphoadenosine phosphosulfate reductase family protein [Candidatus Methanomethylophilaceae archaeon]|nr:phosphoadenosine phosphosulfate reductase family protein [Candidatus Methanomethylophilaceae archaeon]
MAITRLGKNHLRWCYECNLPIMESKECPVCGSPTSEIVLTPPADARPGFEHDISLIRGILDRDYGEGTGARVIPDDRVVLLSKAPGIDRMDEVIIDGEVIATMRYDIGSGWKFVARMQGAYRIGGDVSKGYVVCDEGAVKFIRESKNLMAPGVKEADPGIKVGDEIIIINSAKEVIATGLARMSGPEMVAADKGVAVKTRWYKPEEFVDRSGKPNSWEKVVEANAAVMEKRITEATGFIRNTIERNNLPAIVSFSGGKDSLATLLLTVDAGLKLPVLFVDTGLEFDETVQHVRDVCARHGLQLMEEKAPTDAFFGNLVYFGPPAKDFRWCCKTNKLGPTVGAITKNFPDGVLSFIGQRKYESEARNQKPRVWKNPWTPGQIGASPIQNWAAMHVWLYIFMRKEPYNVWYTRGLDRIGCFLCPASDLAEFDAVAGVSSRWGQWDEYLTKYMEERGLPKEWKEYGLWRWKNAPDSIRREVQRVSGRDVSELTRQTKTPEKGPLTIRKQEGFSPCTIGYSVEAALSRPINLEEVKPFCHALGWVVDMDPEGEFVTADYITIYREGSIICKSHVQNDAAMLMDQTFQVIVRAEQCVGCGLCAARCEEGALYMEGGKVRIHEDECIFCKDCFGPCPSVNFVRDEGFDQRFYHNERMREP